MSSSGPRLARFLRAATVLAVLTGATGALSSCAVSPSGEATVGLARSETGVVVAVVIVCDGLAGGLQLSTEDGRAPVFGDRRELVTTWRAPEPVSGIGATDLVGDTSWPADPALDALLDDTVYSLTVLADEAPVEARPVAFIRSQFDTLSAGEVLVGDVRDGSARYVGFNDFFGDACADGTPAP